MKVLNFIIIATFLVCISCSDQEKTCRVTGTLNGLPCDTIILTKSRDFREMTPEKFLVVDDYVDFSFHFTFIEAFEMKFKKGDSEKYRFIFFPRNGKINFEVDGIDESFKHKIRGGKNNRELAEITDKYYNEFLAREKVFQDSINLLREARQIGTDEYYSITDELKHETDSLKRISLNQRLTKINQNHGSVKPVYRSLINSRDSSFKEGITWLHDVAAHGYSLPAYYYFLERLYGFYGTLLKDDSNYREDYDKFQHKFPDHPYNQIVENILKGKENIREGGNYLDFTAPDLAGEQFTLSKLIQGKYAIIDFWYPWCGPCIEKSRRLVPVYNDFHESGFTVVGVAGDGNDVQAIRDRLDKDKYPWITLISPGDQNNIWNLYDISNLGGSTFMVDPAGKILAVNPTSEEVRAMLLKYLKI